MLPQISSKDMLQDRGTGLGCHMPPEAMAQRQTGLLCLDIAAGSFCAMLSYTYFNTGVVGDSLNELMTSPFFDSLFDESMMAPDIGYNLTPALLLIRIGAALPSQTDRYLAGPPTRIVAHYFLLAADYPRHQQDVFMQFGRYLRYFR